MLNVQKYLVEQTEAGKTPFEALQSLNDTFGIKVRDYPNYGVVLLDYDMIGSPRHHAIVDECRSLILDADNFGIVSRKFQRFYNVGEVAAYEADFDWSNCAVQEKADGSLIGVYYNRRTDNWHISTRGMADAGGTWNGSETFHTRVLAAFGINEEQLQDVFQGWEGATLVFEYTGPSNKIVTPYTKEEMVLLAVIDNDGYEYKVEDFLASDTAGLIKFRLVETYPIASQEELLAAASTLDGLREGFVVRDIHGKRLKLKSPLYVKAHKIRGQNGDPTIADVTEIVLDGDEAEVLTYFPEWRERMDAAKTMVNGWLATLESVYEANRGMESQKDFALAIQGTPGTAVMFQARKLGLGVREAFDKLPVASKLKFFQGVAA